MCKKDASFRKKLIAIPHLQDYYTYTIRYKKENPVNRFIDIFSIGYIKTDGE